LVIKFVSMDVARRRGATRVPQMCPECVRTFSKQTTTKCRFAGTLAKPSDGLEPSTPSLPPGVTRVHARSLATQFLLQIAPNEAARMRRETSRVSFSDVSVLCPRVDVYSGNRCCSLDRPARCERSDETAVPAHRVPRSRLAARQEPGERARSIEIPAGCGRRRPAQRDEVNVRRVEGQKLVRGLLRGRRAIGEVGRRGRDGRPCRVTAVGALRSRCAPRGRGQSLCVPRA
jgi:hypothetical protein